MSKIKVMNDPARTKALIDKMTKAGVKYVQIEVPDMDGMLRGKITKPSKGFGDLGNAYCTILYGLSTQDDVMESEFSSFENGSRTCLRCPTLIRRSTSPGARSSRPWSATWLTPQAANFVRCPRAPCCARRSKRLRRRGSMYAARSSMKPTSCAPTMT